MGGSNRAVSDTLLLYTTKHYGVSAEKALQPDVWDQTKKDTPVHQGKCSDQEAVLQGKVEEFQYRDTDWWAYV